MIYFFCYSIFQSTLSDHHLMTTSDIWQSSPCNSNRHSQSFYFPSSFDSQEFPTTDTQFFNYPSSSSLVDSYSHGYSNNYPYSTQTGYNSIPLQTSNYYPPANSYENFQPIYTDPHPTLPLSTDYQSTLSSWQPIECKSEISTLNSNKQPCLVCQEESSGYHFGAYTCESCKAFYGRITKGKTNISFSSLIKADFRADPNIAIKHSCDAPLPTITKFNRKDCRACRKAKCEEVGMTITSKDRFSRRKINTKTSLISIENLLEQLKYDLTYQQLSNSSALTNLVDLLELPSIIPIPFDYHSLYINAMNLWRNQSQHSSSSIVLNISSNETIAVLLFLFYSLMLMKDNNSNQLTDQIKFDQLVHILQQEINRITGLDHRLAARIKALFMKCYVALAQYHSTSSNIFDSNHSSL